MVLDLSSNDNDMPEQVALEREFHISMGRTVAIRDHQNDYVVSMLRERLQSYKEVMVS